MPKTITTHANIIKLKDLRENMETYIKRIGQGESLMVVRRSEPVFRITPVDAEDEAGWETLIDFTKIRKGGVPLGEVRKAIRAILAE